MPSTLQTVLLLVASNVFMTFAWYAHLKNLADKPWIAAALMSWGIALFYMRAELKWGFLWSALCRVGAVHFMFRGTQ